ncbi:hypothetical protein [Novosphingobium sp. BL-52-GroH]|uniref:hypothetical protein n=1 Tax=Novosphingobium sp. BL-52-GroH TaxID=3349877 RepID=UPI0038517607
MQHDAGNRFGVLVGWTSQDLGARMMLAIQTYERATWEEGEEPLLTHVMMTKSQATVLANYLLKASGAIPPPRRRWLAAIFG